MFILVNSSLRRSRFFFIAFSDSQNGGWLVLAFLLDQLSFHSNVVVCGPLLSSCPVRSVVWSAACSANQWCWLQCSPAANKHSRTLRTSPVWKHAKEGFLGILQASKLYFTSLGHFCNIRTFFCVFPDFTVFIFVTRKLNIVSLKDYDLKEPK